MAIKDAHMTLLADTGDRKHMFRVAGGSSGSSATVLVLAASSEAERKEWMTKITDTIRAIEKGERRASQKEKD